MEILVPLRVIVETAKILGRPRRERELLNLGFVSGLQRVVCESLNGC